MTADQIEEKRREEKESIRDATTDYQCRCCCWLFFFFSVIIDWVAIDASVEFGGVINTGRIFYEVWRSSPASLFFKIKIDE